VKALIHKYKIGKMEKHIQKTRWEEDYEMIENEGLFEEYLEMGECGFNSTYTCLSSIRSVGIRF
jgi:hypothetical protein